MALKELNKKFLNNFDLRVKQYEQILTKFEEMSNFIHESLIDDSIKKMFFKLKNKLCTRRHEEYIKMG